MLGSFTEFDTHLKKPHATYRFTVNSTGRNTTLKYKNGIDIELVKLWQYFQNLSHTQTHKDANIHKNIVLHIHTCKQEHSRLC